MKTQFLTCYTYNFDIVTVRLDRIASLRVLSGLDRPDAAHVTLDPDAVGEGVLEEATLMADLDDLPIEMFDAIIKRWSINLERIKASQARRAAEREDH